MEHSVIESSFAKADVQFETPLRPSMLDEFVGQERLKERLAVYLGAAKARQDTLGHCLFGGPPGLGKTTLAHIVAKSMGTNLIVTSGPAIEKAGDLAGILTNLQAGDVLFIDEIHRMPRVIEEYLYPAMEDFCLDLIIDSGPNARSVKIKLKPFTLVAATTRLGLLSDPLRSRFGMTLRLSYYEPEALATIIRRTATLLAMTLDADSSLAIAKRARGTPRIANHLVRWVRDFAQMRSHGMITPEIVAESLDLLAIDHCGLDEMDKKILEVLIDLYGGGPVGLSTLAVAVGEEPHTLAEVCEPFLILEGFLKRTPRGREATPRAYEHLGKTFTDPSKE